MTGFAYRLDERRALISPVVGDAEVRNIAFEFPNARIDIVQPFDGTLVNLCLHDMLFLFIHTDHPQNVIENIFIYEKWEDVRFPPEVNTSVLRKEFGSQGRYIVVVESIAGGPLVCGARDFSINLTSPSDAQRSV
jgi:hypothetical protein